MTDDEQTVENQHELTVAMPPEAFDCVACPARTPRASYEDGQWVCYGCGTALPDEVAEVADTRVSDGHGEYDYTQKLGEAIGGAATEVAKETKDAN